jgi:nitroimidazol reductase NimA-like FMN-containing flavoprotein (pyridoxamine 5'-phosphate oxidase superfamily)
MIDSRDLDARECERLLRAGAVGRVAFSTPEGPHIVPVDYVVVEDTIVVRTSAYSVLGSNAPGAVLAFQIDHHDPETRSGWSVMARGRAWAESDPQEMARLRASASQGSQASQPAHPGNLFLRMRWSSLSGRHRGTSGTPSDHSGNRTLTPG